MEKKNYILIIDNELDKLFSLYSNGQKFLDYKNFIGILFDNPSLISQEEESNTQENKNEENEE